MILMNQVKVIDIRNSDFGGNTVISNGKVMNGTLRVAEKKYDSRGQGADRSRCWTDLPLDSRAEGGDRYGGHNSDPYG